MISSLLGKALLPLVIFLSSGQGFPGVGSQEWVQSYQPTTLWSGWDHKAITFGTVGQWAYFARLGPRQGGRLYVHYPGDPWHPPGDVWIDARDVGPSGPPPLLAGTWSGWNYTAGHGQSAPRAFAKPGSVIRHGNSSRRRVAITFDVEVNANVDPILDVAARRGVKLTFFVTGLWAGAHPSSLLRIVREGHDIGNHSYSHPYVARLGPEAMRAQIRDADEVVRGLTGVGTRPYFRPPFLSWSSTEDSVLAEEGYAAILWSVDPQDWRGIGWEETARRVLASTGPGDIVLLHAHVAGAARALDSIARGLQQEGYQLVTLSRLLAP